MESVFPRYHNFLCKDKMFGIKDFSRKYPSCAPFESFSKSVDILLCLGMKMTWILVEHSQACAQREFKEDIKMRYFENRRIWNDLFWKSCHPQNRIRFHEKCLAKIKTLHYGESFDRQDEYFARVRKAWI